MMIKGNEMPSSDKPVYETRTIPSKCTRLSCARKYTIVHKKHQVMNEERFREFQHARHVSFIVLVFTAIEWNLRF